MTHDELLALIDKEVFTIVSVNDPSDIEIARLRRLKVALRAVVELHKPTEDGKCSICVGVYYASTAMVQSITYPCLTTQAIEKESG